MAGGVVQSAKPEQQKELDRLYNASDSFASIKATAEKITGEVVDEDRIRLPQMREMFGSKEEAEEAWNALPRRQAKQSKATK